MGTLYGTVFPVSFRGVLAGRHGSQGDISSYNRLMKFKCQGLTLATVVAMTIAVLAGCAGDTETVVGRLIDVQSSGLLVLDSIEVIDADGRQWKLEGPGDFGQFTPSHLRQHMVLGEQLQVSFHRDEDSLVIDRLSDYP